MNRTISTLTNSRRMPATVLAALFALGAVSVHAQESDSTSQNLSLQVQEMAVIDVTGSPNALVIQAPATAGATPENATDDSTFAQYTSTVDTGERAITAQLDLAAPAGTSLSLEATPAVDEGTSAGVISLETASALDIVTGIGNVATGDGPGDGAQLNYELSVDDFSALEVGETNVQVTLTLTEAS